MGGGGIWFVDLVVILNELMVLYEFVQFDLYENIKFFEEKEVNMKGYL